MKQQNSQKPILQDQLPPFNSIEDRIFSEEKGEIYIGKEKISPEMRDLLKEQARYFSTSHLYEVLKSTIVNEAYDIALGQSTDFDQVRFAKALYHWHFVFENMMQRLTK